MERSLINSLNYSIGQREKCKDNLIESLRGKQSRTDHQLRQLREVSQSLKNILHVMWHKLFICLILIHAVI